MWTLWLACSDPDPVVQPPAPEYQPPAPVPDPVPAVETADSGDSGQTEPDELQCDQPFTPCGGDFRDTVWRFVGLCEGSEVIEAVSSCGDVNTLGANFYVGTVQFFSNNRYRFDLSSRVGVGHYHWPPSCSEYCEPDDPLASCTDDGAGGCLCDYYYDMDAGIIEGDWWIDSYYGQDLELQVGELYNNGSSAFEQWKWCVEGDEMRLRGWYGNVQVLVREP